MRMKLLSGLLIVLFAFITQASEIRRASPRPSIKKTGVEEIVIAKPFKVRIVRGTICYADAEPLSGASFELHGRNGRSFGTTADEHGSFVLNDIPPGTYDFRVTHYGFNPTSGKVIVSGRAPAKAAINVRLYVAT